MKPTPVLFCVLVACYSVTGLVIPKSKPCSKEEIMKPLNDIYKLVEEMRSQDADIESLKKKVSQDCEDIPSYLDAIKNVCGEEQNESVEKISDFFNTMQALEDIIEAIDSGNKSKAKELLEDIHCEHIIQIFVRHYGIDVENIEKLIEIISMMDDMKLINKMIEAITYIIDDSNKSVSKKLLPIIKEQITANKDKVEEGVILAAKLNMKELAKRNLPGCFCGIKALREIDIEMADQAVYETAFQLMSDNFFSPAFKMAVKAPFVHMQAIALEAIFDKLVALEMQSGTVAARTLALAKNLIENEEIKQNVKCMEILNNIINNSSVFAKNMEENGYICRNSEDMRALVTGEEAKQEEYNQYHVFYNDEDPEQLTGGFLEKPDGELMMFTIERKYNGKVSRHSLLLKNADYPENMYLGGDVVSRKTIGKETENREEICNMNPKPEQNICNPFSFLLNMKSVEEPSTRAAIYEKYLESSQSCKRT